MVILVPFLFAVAIWLALLFTGRKKQKPFVEEMGSGYLWAGLLIFFLGVASMVVFLSGLLAISASFICQKLGVRGSRLAAITFAMIPITFLSLGYLTWSRVQRQMEVQKIYPFESLENRLAYETARITDAEGETQLSGGVAVIGAPQQSVNAYKLVSSMDDRLQYQSISREAMLETLHQSKLDAFARSPGFGPVRGIRTYSEERLRTEPRPSITPPAAPAIPYVPTTGEDAPVAGDLAQVEQVTSGSKPPFSRAKLDELHLASSIDFVNPNGFGLVRSLQEVAGFEPHAFSKMPELYEQKYQSSSPCGGGDLPETNEPEENWIIVSLQLVSLLKHEKPMVYATKDLPRMDVLTSEDVPIRTLNAFESEALPKVITGKTLIVQETPNRIHMLGAVRAGETCSKCHQVPRLTLLGAFSYELARAQPVPEQPAGPAEGPEL